jgi:hypothetical protein
MLLLLQTCHLKLKVHFLLRHYSAVIPASDWLYCDHPSAREVPPGRGPQCGVAPVNIPIRFWSRAAYSQGGGGFSVGLVSCSFSV